MPFFFPHAVAKPSNHLSYCGTKWLHWRIFSVLACASAEDTNGNETAGARAAVPAVAPTRFKNPRRVTDDVDMSRSDRMFVSSLTVVVLTNHKALRAGVANAFAWFLDCGER